MTGEAFELMADVLPEPMLLVTVSGRVLAANRPMREMLGADFVSGKEYDISEIFRTPAEELKEYLLLCSGVRQFVPGALKLRFRAEPELELRCEGAAVNGPEAIESQIVLRLKVKHAAIERFRGLNEQIEILNREIAERIRLEEEREQTETRLVDSLKREKAAREAAERASRAKDEFLASLSHELRTPLSPALLTASDAAEDAGLPADVRGRFEAIRKNIELEARLIDDLLDLTAIAHKKLVLHSRVMEAERIFREALAKVQPEAKQKKIEVVTEWRSPQAMVLADEVRLQQVFWNVLKNAVKFTPEHGKITVRASEAEGGLRVEIKDTGIGLSAVEAGRIFDAFSQGDHFAIKSHPFGGLGLGLAISRQLVEMHSGRISVRSEGKGKGAAFTIELPLAKTATAEPAGTKNNEVPQTVPPAEGLKCILLVEDHEATRGALAYLLMRRRYKVLPAANVTEAKEIAAREKVDFVISDIGLPDGNGNDLMKELQAEHGLKGIALSGFGMEQDVVKSMASGFVTYLIKPVNVKSLENALKEMNTAG
jgi:signal transduction histidine kinase